MSTRATRIKAAEFSKLVKKISETSSRSKRTFK